MRARRWAPVLLAAAATLWLTVGVALAHAEAPPAKAQSAEGAESHAINWYWGMLGEKDGVEPSLAWRPTGMSPPLVAETFDAALLLYLVYRFSRRPVKDALKKRKEAILQGMETAAKMKSDAAERLAEYERKLQRTDDDIERVKAEMRAAGESERVRILEEAREKRARMERDAHHLIEQELQAAREALLRETVQGAVRAAEQLLVKQIGPSDQQRLADEYLTSLDRADINAPGGRA
jgi:F-type H+-transporting ATPase subunit b